MRTILHYFKSNVEVLLVILSTAFLFYYIFLRCQYSFIALEDLGTHLSDIPAHAHSVYNNLQNGTFFKGNFLLYLLANVFSGFSLDFKAIGRAFGFLLALAEGATYLLFKGQFEKMGLSRFHSGLLSGAMLIVFVIPYLYFLSLFGIVDDSFSTYYYLTHYVPTIWHNSTIIFSMPFSLGIFFLSEKVLKEFQRNDILKICILVAIDVLIKPSFFFIFLVSFPIVAFVKYHFTKEFLSCLLPIAVGLVCLAYVYISIYKDASDGSSVIIDFNRILHLNNTDLYKVVSSLFFPVLFTFFNWSSIEKNESLLYIFLLLSSAIGISLVCAELGPRAGHGNMCWQTVPAMQITYFAILRYLITQKPSTRYEKLTKYTFSTIFALHVVSGIWYLTRYIITGTYY